MGRTTAHRHVSGGTELDWECQGWARAPGGGQESDVV